MKKSFTPFRAVRYWSRPHCYFLFFSLLLSVIAVAQRQVTGKVTGMAGEPMTGVSIQVRGAAGGATTDTAGNYSISVPSDTSVLVFSFVGFSSQEVTVGNRTEVNISLSAAASELNTIVVVGYGTQRKRDLTGSISSVNGDEVARLPNTNPIASLQGKVAGLTVANSGVAGASPVVRIRGINSTNTANPVYVVDGILQDNIDYLNPADIESIDVLKDPSSIAIYGLRAANGVIAVTLKKAARGRTVVNLQSSVGVQRVQ
ncbi:MAG TPA: TonB-dependent receptor plug domain-containing protein, partial [Flavisolibacter sp.]